MVGTWFSVSVWLNAACLWMALFAILDITLMLHLTGVRAGWLRFFGIFLGLSIIVFASQWLIAANAFGMEMGLLPQEAAEQIGPVLAWEFTRLRITQGDLIFLSIGIILSFYFELNDSKK